MSDAPGTGTGPLWSDDAIANTVYQLTYKVTDASALAQMRSMMYAMRDDYEARIAELTAQLAEPQGVTVGPVADWTHAPKWAKYWAVDPNGWAHWFQEEPILALTITYCGWVPKTINGVQQGAELWAQELDLDLGIDWRLLKQSREASGRGGES